MSVPQLLSSTTLSTEQTHSALQLRKHFLQQVHVGEPQAAMRVLCFIFFFTPFSARSELVKKHLLVKTWDAIEEHYRTIYFKTVQDGLKFLGAAVRKSITEHVDGLEYSANLYLLAELLSEREFAAELGKCGAMIRRMCAKNGTILLSSLEYVTQQLR